MQAVQLRQISSSTQYYAPLTWYNYSCIKVWGMIVCKALAAGLTHSMLTQSAYLVGIFALSRFQQTFLHHLVQEPADSAHVDPGQAGGGNGGVEGGR